MTPAIYPATIIIFTVPWITIISDTHDVTNNNVLTVTFPIPTFGRTRSELSKCWVHAYGADAKHLSFSKGAQPLPATLTLRNAALHSAGDMRRSLSPPLVDCDAPDDSENHVQNSKI